VVNFVLCFSISLSAVSEGVLCISHLSFIQRSNNNIGGWTSKSIPLHCLASISGFDVSANVIHVIVTNTMASWKRECRVFCNNTKWWQTTRGMTLKQWGHLSYGGKLAAHRLLCHKTDVTLSYSRVKGSLYTCLLKRVYLYLVTTMDPSSSGPKTSEDTF
jgi:hypothetical protein